MAIEKKLDGLGRIVLPKEMRDRLGIDEEIPVSITSNDEEIIIRNTRPMKKRKEIEKMLEQHKQSSTDYYRGYKDALKWVLNDKR